ncbi:hypothetical protein NVV30_23400, partial [Pseudomonas syringae]|uniref:hypothetical protein n=1 Tax=Pseudomonas syringae TaxID=317 RepID=UPI00215AF0F1
HNSYIDILAILQITLHTISFCTSFMHIVSNKITTPLQSTFAALDNSAMMAFCSAAFRREHQGGAK